jgi:hypothetical protein
MNDSCYGNIMIEKSRRDYLLIRVASNSESRPNGCIEWTATKNNIGYGLIHFAALPGDGYRSLLPVHRALYMAYHNVILKRDQIVMHTCDNRACVNIEHLLIGTQKESIQDMIAEGRKAKKHKLHTRIRRLSNDDICAIRSATGLLKDIALRYGTTPSYVSKIRTYQAKTLL